MAVAEQTKTETKYDRLMAWQRGEKPGPWMISLYPTYRCNIKCKICWKRAFDEPLTPSQELPNERMLSLVDEAAELGVQEWTIGGGGELMLRRKIVIEMVEKIRSYGMNGVIQSNGTVWSDEHIDRLIDVQWRDMYISLDGPTAELNEAIRVENNFEMTYDFLKRITKRKRERNSRYPVVNLVSVINNVNYDKMNLFVDLSAEIGLDPGVLTCVDLIVYGDNDKPYELSPEQRKELPQLMEKTIAYARKKGVPTHYDHYLNIIRDMGHNADAMALYHHPELTVSSKSMCYEPFLHCVIVPEGNGGPCCTWHDLTSDNIRDNSLQELWTGPYMSGIRDKILGGSAPDFCKECMPTRIQQNRDMQTHMAHIEQSQLASEPMTPVALVAKAGNSLRKHGVAKSFKRGKEWLQLRNQARDL
jgi:MoaA/NifB/PqqE/SkfB family radical SAM enzyme